MKLAEMHKWYDVADVPGVEVVLHVQDPGASYSFDDVMVIRYEGALWIAADAGCSCPTPFEDAEWEELTTWQQFVDVIDEWDPSYGSTPSESVLMERHEAKEFMATVIPS